MRSQRGRGAVLRSGRPCDGTRPPGSRRPCPPQQETCSPPEPSLSDGHRGSRTPTGTRGRVWGQLFHRHPRIRLLTQALLLLICSGPGHGGRCLPAWTGPRSSFYRCCLGTQQAEGPQPPRQPPTPPRRTRGAWPAGQGSVKQGQEKPRARADPPSDSGQAVRSVCPARPRRQAAHEYFRDLGLVLICGLSAPTG